jgi:hypothetical protein
MPKEVGNARPERMTFFPDGQRLLVGGWKNESQPAWIVPLDGSAPSRARTARMFALSPDGTRLAHVTEKAIVVGPVGEGATTRVAPVYRDGSALIAWSPTGAVLAARGSGNVREDLIQVIAPDGSWTKTVYSNSFSVGTIAPMVPVWTAPDRIAFPIAMGETEVALVEQTLDASYAPVGAPRVLWKGPVVNMFDLAFRAGRFFYLQTNSQRDIYVGRLTADGKRMESTLTRFTRSDENDSLAGWLPDGRMLFTSMRDGKIRIYAQALDAHTPEAISGDAEMVAAGSLANGDVVAVRRDGERNDMVVFAPNGPARTLFALGPIRYEMARVDECVRCSSGSPVCVMSEARGDESVFSSFDPTTGARSAPFFQNKLDLSPLYCAVSNDGSTMFLPHAENNIQIVSIKTGAVQTISGPQRSAFQYYFPQPGGRVLVSGMGVFDPYGASANNTFEQEYGFGWMNADGGLEPLWTSTTLWVFWPIIAPNHRDIAAIVRLFDSDIFSLTPP